MQHDNLPSPTHPVKPFGLDTPGDGTPGTERDHEQIKPFGFDEPGRDHEQVKPFGFDKKGDGSPTGGTQPEGAPETENASEA